MPALPLPSTACDGTAALGPGSPWRTLSRTDGPSRLLWGDSVGPGTAQDTPTLT